jgi:hypothetical protein
VTGTWVAPSDPAAEVAGALLPQAASRPSKAIAVNVLDMNCTVIPLFMKRSARQRTRIFDLQKIHARSVLWTRNHKGKYRHEP